jgi:hypothetical protein
MYYAILQLLRSALLTMRSFVPMLLKSRVVSDYLSSRQLSPEPSPAVSSPASSPTPKLSGGNPSMLKIKETVNMVGLRPEVIPLLIVANEVYASLGYDCVVTSVTDSKHTAGVSLHPFGFAIDFRTKHVPVEKHQAIVDEMKVRLGPQFDVVLEVDHIHGEFDNR